MRNAGPDASVADRLASYLRWELGDDVALLAQRYPDETTLSVDWTQLARWDPDLAEDILDAPDSMGDYLDEALRLVSLPVDVTLGQADTRFTNLPPSHTVAPGEYSPSDRQGELLAFEAQVAKRTQVQPKVAEGAFECQRCGTITRVPQPERGFIEPHECQGCEKKGPFRLDDDLSEYIDAQKLKLENPESNTTGGEPASIITTLTGDLAGHDAVESCQRVTAIGKLQLTGGPQIEQVLNANNLQSNEVDFREKTFNADEQALIERARDRPESFDLDASNPTTLDVFLEAAAPKFVAGSNRRDEQVVKAIVLQLVGASTFDARDGSHYRGDIHVLLPGDPGTGKSVIAKWAANVAPKSAFASGERTSGPGLTAAAVKDDFSDDGFTIQPGVLVRAHRGLAVVDELDKAGEEAISKTHSALADQILPVTLAGQSMTLPAECGLLGVANPSGGHFTGSESLVDALPLQSPLLSRFDLILQIRSKEDAEHVQELAESMLQTWDAALRDERGEFLDEEDRQQIEGLLSMDEYQTLLMKAKQLDPTPASQDVIEALSTWFTEQKMALPNRYRDAFSEDGEYGGPPMPVTARKLGAARRVAQASARAHLRDEMTLDDVQIAKELVSRTLADLDIPVVDNAGVGGGEAPARDSSEITGVTP